MVRAIIIAGGAAIAAIYPIDMAKSACHVWRDAAVRCGNVRHFPRYIVKHNLLCIDNIIDLRGNLYREILSFKLKEGVLVSINSDGGSVRHAISIVEYLSKKRYDAVVSGSCYSSCAQFLFLGARHKVIIGEAVVAMHGYPFTDAEIAHFSLSERDKRRLRNESRRFVRFYKKRRIPMSIISRQKDDTGKYLTSGGVSFWVPSKIDYKRNNVNVAYCSK